MKKIMFNDHYGLTQAVLEGRKTMTRRIISYPKKFHGKDVCGFYVYRRKVDAAITDVCMYDEEEIPIDEGQILPKYKIGEEVAVAQSYRDCGGLIEAGVPRWDVICQTVGATNAGWNNKMFVKPELMPHRIRITGIGVERLQDISDEDCLREGVQVLPEISRYYFERTGCEGFYFYTSREAFASLIDKVSGRGTWKSNPWVFVYEFELLK